jgi:hypothetical protein
LNRGVIDASACALDIGTDGWIDQLETGCRTRWIVRGG